MRLCERKRQELRRAITSMLELRDDRRSVSRILGNRLRAEGWSDWVNFRDFIDTCQDLGFHVYEGHTDKNRYSHFIGLDPKPICRPDHFEALGYVIVTATGAYVNRSNPTGTSMRKASARAWKTERGVRAYCEREGYDPAGIHHTRDLDDGKTPVARTG